MSYKENGKCNCELCGRPPAFRFSDVFFQKPYFDEHIAHPDKSPLGNHIESREHKASLMRQIGISETGDKIHGSR